MPMPMQGASHTFSPERAKQGQFHLLREGASKKRSEAQEASNATTVDRLAGVVVTAPHPSGNTLPASGASRPSHRVPSRLAGAI